MHAHTHSHHTLAKKFPLVSSETRDDQGARALGLAGAAGRGGQCSHTNECLASGLTQLERADAETEIHFP